MPTRILRLAFCLMAMALTPAVYAGDVDAALNRAAVLHRTGDTAAAIPIWQSLAAGGSVDAAYNLAVVYHYADGVVRDYGEAIKWYRLAAERGDQSSQIQLGFMYLNGEGVAADPVMADRWFTLHLREHAHHEHSPQMQAWRRQALALIEERDRREAFQLSQRDGEKVLADLKRRAATVAGASDIAPAGAAQVANAGER